MPVSPIIWLVSDLVNILELSINKVSQVKGTELEAYSIQTTPNQRRHDVELVLDELNPFAIDFALNGKLENCNDIRVIFGLWRRLDTWYEYLSKTPPYYYLVVMDEHNLYQNPLHFLLKPQLLAEQELLHYLIEPDKVQDFIKPFMDLT